MTYEEIIKKIKSLEIQGAESVAIMATKAFALKLEETQDEKKLNQYILELSTLRPTEPALRNCLRYCQKNWRQKNVADSILGHFEDAKKRIAEYGTKKIENGMIIFTHCHSGTVVSILEKAHKDGKKFKVKNTETRPRFQGRLTAKRLNEMGIPVEHYIDSGGKLALKNADLFLFGCDALTSEGRIINKIGTSFLLDIAASRNIPTFCSTNSWKFDPETTYGQEESIEERDPSEVWEDAPKEIKIHNPAFESLEADKITGIISELGVYKPETLIMEIKKTYPWILKI
ncbi:hypothetical protein HYV56_02450 [Candidatus Peregrinibacteria bacterium]|nr:hypothetical protein [Candidatus Peregrinibacteria bacterium]